MADSTAAVTLHDPSTNTVECDASGNERAERIKAARAIYAQRVAVRKEEIIALVMRQTNYTREEATAKLQENNFQYIAVIKEYMKPTAAKEVAAEPPPDKRSVNQMVMGEIRGFMDTANRMYSARKERQEAITKYKQALLARLLQERNQQNAEQASAETAIAKKDIEN